MLKLCCDSQQSFGEGCSPDTGQEPNCINNEKNSYDLAAVEKLFFEKSYELKKIINTCVLPLLKRWYSQFNQQIEWRLPRDLLRSRYHIRNEEITKRTKVEAVIGKTAKMKWTWLGHVAQQEDDQLENLREGLCPRVDANRLLTTNHRWSHYKLELFFFKEFSLMEHSLKWNKMLKMFHLFIHLWNKSLLLLLYGSILK